ncbi:MAG TPA: hypothetical protein PK585_04640 [Amphiplicatus sp.]|nr:hypothetical protein [Caulobacterales bacterium]HOP19349.1 hypothetical protein [Amphiplicatus sp.]HRX37787.1 hypothetical protein [Parvularculaceae bacterium]
MITVFDVYSVGLLLASLAVFVVRYIRRDPPIMPYLVIACVCGVGNWLGELGGGWAAFSLLVAASFLFLGCLFHPDRQGWRRNDPFIAKSDKPGAPVQ